jgi:hypothetical protein
MGSGAIPKNVLRARLEERLDDARCVRVIALDAART